MARTTLKRLGTAVRKLRLEEGLTQEQLAAATEMAAESISRLENGDLNISIKKLERVAIALGASIPNLFDGATPPKAKLARLEEKRIMRLLASLDDEQLKKVDAGLISFLGLLPKPARKRPARRRTGRGR